MDYRYIEQLLERYFSVETTIEEEEILRAFFSQKEIPASMEKYRDLFVFQLTEQQEAPLGDDFDSRIMEMVSTQHPTVKARVISLNQRLMPLFKAAAVVAIFLTLGQAAQTPWDASWNNHGTNYAEGYQSQVDTINVTPIQAENFSESPVDSVKAIPESLPKD